MINREECTPTPPRMQLVWVANLHLEGSPYRPNDRVSQLRSALQRLEAHIGGGEGECPRLALRCAALAAHATRCARRRLG
jgi:hypothetical protein